MSDKKTPDTTPTPKKVEKVKTTKPKISTKAIQEKSKPAPEPKKDTWQPVNDGPDGFALAEERAPWLKWGLSILLLSIIAIAAIWLISAISSPENLPSNPVTIGENQQTEPDEKPQSADDAAWVKALEADTLDAYRAYLSEFPDGKHKDKAQAEIDKYDDDQMIYDEEINVEENDYYNANATKNLETIPFCFFRTQVRN